MIAAFFARYGAALAGVGLLLVMTFYGGKLHERAAWEARRTEKVAEARATERDGAAIATTAERDALAAETKRRENADAEIVVLRARLAQLPRCPVPRALVRVLDGAGVPATAGSSALAGAAAANVAGNAGDGRPHPHPTLPPEGEGVVSAAAPVTVDASAVMENCAWNRLNVADPNAAQIEELQRFYDALKARYNKP